MNVLANQRPSAAPAPPQEGPAPFESSKGIETPSSFGFRFSVFGFRFSVFGFQFSVFSLRFSGFGLRVPGLTTFKSSFDWSPQGSFTPSRRDASLKSQGISGVDSRTCSCCLGHATQLLPLNPEPCTLHPEPCTLNPAPSTMNTADCRESILSRAKMV